MKAASAMALFLLIPLVFTGCEKKSTSQEVPAEVNAVEKIFPIPYFPAKEANILGMPVSVFSKEWVSACIYSEQIMNSAQAAFIKSLPSMQDEGNWGTSFEGDFDGDGNIEGVYYGAYQDTGGMIGNFLLVTRGSGENRVPLLLREFVDSGGRFACFYLVKKDHSLLFGSGLVGSELNWKLTWKSDGPQLINMGLD